MVQKIVSTTDIERLPGWCKRFIEWAVKYNNSRIPMPFTTIIVCCPPYCTTVQHVVTSPTTVQSLVLFIVVIVLNGLASLSESDLVVDTPLLSVVYDGV